MFASRPTRWILALVCGAFFAVGCSTTTDTPQGETGSLSLDLVIAEGVESQAQLEYLREIDCSEAQGFLFGKPLPSDVISQLLIQEPYATPGSRSDSNKGTHWHH